MVRPTVDQAVDWDRSPRQSTNPERQPSTSVRPSTPAAAAMGTPGHTPRRAIHASPESSTRTSTLGLISFVWICFVRRLDPQGSNGSVRVSLESFIDSSAISPPHTPESKILAARLVKLRGSLMDQSIIVDPDDLIIATHDPRGRKPIVNDTNLQEALRYMASSDGIDQIRFFVCPGRSPCRAVVGMQTD